MDDVVSYARMLRLAGEDRFQNFATLALVGKCLIGFGCGDVERERVKDGGFGVVRISSLQCTHLLFEYFGVLRRRLSVLTINFRERFDVAFLASSGVAGL